MRICLVAPNAVTHDPRATARLWSLSSVGHDVVAVGLGPSQLIDTEWGRLKLMAPRWPTGDGLVPTVVRRLQPQKLQRRLRDRRQAASVQSIGAQLVHVLDPRVVAAAERAVRGEPRLVADPALGVRPELDLAWAAPEAPQLAAPVAGWAAAHHFPDDDRSWRPVSDRHEGTRIAVCFRRTDRNPGRYLESALVRAGVEVVPIENRLDWDEVPRLDGVVFVESPLPPLEVHGQNPGVPVAFWVHHGEHHLDLNMRLCRRYGVDVVLLAHSWHLAHRFPVPVARFPFAVAPELFRPGAPLDQRPFDVAFVGSNLAGEGPYTRRRQLLDRVREVVDSSRVAVAEGVPPEDVAALYATARIVPNEGGTRHRPITMRVFEAAGTGAVLLSEPAPGLDLLLDRDGAFVPLVADVGAQVRELLADEARMAKISSAALEAVETRHTYDHRVDDLIELLRDTTSTQQPQPIRRSDLRGLVAGDPEVQRVLVTDEAMTSLWRDREVWHVDQVAGRLQPGAYEAVVISDANAAAELVTAAWRYVYATPDAADAVRAALVTQGSSSAASSFEGGLRVDLAPDSYRL